MSPDISTRKILFLVALIGAAAVGADESRLTETVRQNAPHDQAFSDDAENAATRESEVVTADPVNTGYVFVNGHYLAPPYTIRETAAGVIINDTAILGNVPEPEDLRSDRGSWRGSRIGRDTDSRTDRSGLRRMAIPAEWIARQLESECVLVDFPEQPVVVLGQGGRTYDFFQVILNPDSTAKPYRSLLASLPPEADRQMWTEWLSNFTPPDTLRERIAILLRDWESVEEANEAARSAIRRLDSLAYPLTTLGMILGVLSMGHLMTYPPKSGVDEPSVQTRATVISILLLLVLSILDLAWTILAHHAGHMRELNPLGSRLIEQPEALIAFKTSATLLSCGLLFMLRRRFLAHRASWWLCLVLTLLTFRWVVFNSMFVS